MSFRATCLLVAAILLISGCDPCIGSTLCEEPRVSYLGRVSTAISGEGIVGAEVVATRRSGLTITPSRIAVRTDSSGIFVLRAGADRAGEVVVGLEIATPGSSGSLLRVEGLRLRTTSGKGDALWLGEWQVSPSPAAPSTEPAGSAAE